MAEVVSIILSPLLDAFFERVTSYEFLDLFRGKQPNKELLNKLKIALLHVNAVFEDAEQKQVANDDDVKIWLDELKDVVYEAEDIFDEIDTEAMQSKLDAEFPPTTTKKVRKAISTTLNILFVTEIEPKIKQVLDRLEYLISKKDLIGLKGRVQGKPSERLPTTSFVDESGICGREDDKETIINSLFSNHVSGNELFHVIAIVGMGGLGKTTLAQLVYNDKRVEEYFDLKIWVCVSDDFDVFKITKAILKRSDSSANGDGQTLDWLQTNKLKESLTGKKFLLVLDDVWNDNYMKWESLSNPFRFGAQGSRVLVTTREEQLASVVMQATLIYNLKPLPEKECWSLFARHAFRSISDMDPELEVIGRKIVEKCKGLPLAAKAIGALLRSKVGVDDWNLILRSELWDMQTEIIPALRLSYKYLPTHLKRCFSYCSIFPKDYFFSKKKLVLLWMAEGFLQKSNDKTMEQVGDDYFFDLVSRSFLQPDTYGKFRMHDLVNDLAKCVSGKFIFRLEDGNSLEVMDKTRHLSIVETKIENVSKKLEALDKAKGLRTFLPIDHAWTGLVTRKFIHDLLPMLRFLRVLSFANNGSLSELPDSIDKIRHLRYLDLSFTPIRKLPDSICKLCNLQTLKIYWCKELTALPRDMHKLVSLRHFSLWNTAITEMPLHLGRLKCLQTLDLFVVNKHCGSIIGELGKLKEIGGSLTITQLQNVKSPADALDASLKDKQYLNDLELGWDDATSNISESQITALKNLQPHTNLESLRINNYGGTSFPNWIAHHSFSKMKFLYLYYCKYCHILPSFGQLHSLKCLFITGFHGIARVGKEFYGNGSSTFKPFEALELLRFRDMPDWENWFCFDFENEVEAFPRLKELEIIRCPKLIGGLPIHLPSLTRLVIRECSKLEASLPRSPTLRRLELTNVNEVLLNDFPSGLQEVVLKKCAGLQSLPEGMMDSESPLQELEIDSCCSLMIFSKDGLPSTLVTLKISNCKKLEFPVHFNYSSLKELYLKSNCGSLGRFPVNLIAKVDNFTIEECENLESLTDTEQHEYNSATSIIKIVNCPNFVSFPDGGLQAQKLKTFEILNCRRLKSLPVKMHQLLPSLESLSLRCCPKLQSFGEGGLPTKLKSIRIEDCDNLVACRTTWDLQKLTSLRELCIGGRRIDVESSPEPGLLPVTITSLEIGGFFNMTSLDKMGLQHLNSLENLYIRYLPRLKFMPEERLFDTKSTLIYLHISGIPSMTSLDNLGGLQRLTSLKTMEIRDCPNMKFLPKDGFPDSFSFLKIFFCPLLKKQLQNKKGKEWRKVALIPRIEIDGGLI